MRMKDKNFTNEIISEIKYFINLHPDIVDIILDNYEKNYVVILNLANKKILELK